MNKEILYVDMDGVVADFDKYIRGHNPTIDTMDMGRAEEVDRIMAENRRMFLDLEFIKYAPESIEVLKPHYNIYFLSTPVWDIHESWGDKKIWLESIFGDFAKKRLILTHRKDLALGRYLIDDRTTNGAGEFTGEHIHFGTEKFPDWDCVVLYLLNKLIK